MNPARSIGPALFTGGEALKQLWLFIVAPIAGAVLAALAHRFIAGLGRAGAAGRDLLTARRNAVGDPTGSRPHLTPC